MATTLLLLISLMIVRAQVAAVHFKVVVPDGNSGQGVYIAGSFNYWHAGDSLYKMTKESGNNYSITLPLFSGKKYEYKYTLGNWDKVEIAINDSDIHNRFFFSSDGAHISDTVSKWKETKKKEKKINPQMQRINAMKDSTMAELQPELNNMLGLLKSYIENLLQENPSKRINKKINKKAVKKIKDMYGQVSSLFWEVFATLSTEQKKSILSAIHQQKPNEDIINTLGKALSDTLEGN